MTEISREEHLALERAAIAIVQSNTLDEKIIDKFTRFLEKEFKLNRSLCGDCIYLMRGEPNICNALHLDVGVDECVDRKKLSFDVAKRWWGIEGKVHLEGDHHD
jgi:hypothetical protein